MVCVSSVTVELLFAQDASVSVCEYVSPFCTRLAHSNRASPDIQFLITHSLSLTFAMVARV